MRVFILAIKPFLFTIFSILTSSAFAMEEFRNETESLSNPEVPKCQLLRIDIGEVEFHGEKSRLAGTLILPGDLEKFPNPDQLAEVYLKWLVQNNLIGDNDIIKYRGLKLSQLFTSSISDLPIPAAKYMPIFCHLTWIIDNPLETACKKIDDIKALKYICDLIIKCFEGKYELFKTQDSHQAYKYKEICFQDKLPVLCNAIDRFQKEIRDYAKQESFTSFDVNWQIFCEEYQFYLDGLVWAGNEKLNKHSLPKYAYLGLREASSAVTAVLIFSAVLLDTNISKVMQENSAIFRTITKNGNLATSIMNDIVSLGREIKQAETEKTYNDNFIINMFYQLKENGKPYPNMLQVAIARAVKFHNRTIFDLLTQLNSNQHIYTSSDSKQYFKTVLHVILDSSDWSFLTTRYGLEKINAIQARNIINLDQISTSNYCGLNINLESNMNTISHPIDEIPSEEVITSDVPWNYTL